jgi:hypothetical protein
MSFWRQRVQKREMSFGMKNENIVQSLPQHRAYIFPASYTSSSKDFGIQAFDTQLCQNETGKLNSLSISCLFARRFNAMLGTFTLSNKRATLTSFSYNRTHLFLFSRKTAGGDVWL